MTSSLIGLLAFATYFSTAIAMVVAFGTVYVLMTPHREFRLLRAGCAAAVPAFLGAITGYVVPLTAAMRSSGTLAEFVLWAGLAAAVQILAYAVVRLILPDISTRIANNDVAAGAFLGGLALTFGLLNAASMTP